MAWGVILLYVFLVVWAGVLVWSFRTSRWIPFITMGLVGALVLNLRYVLGGVESGIVYFIGIADPFVNWGADGPSAVTTTCPDNACSPWGDTFTNHASWTIAFYDRFVGGPVDRIALLYGHIIFNTIGLILATVQIFRPGTTHRSHRVVGTIALACVLISLTCAGILTSELDTVEGYGGIWGELGLFFLSFCVLAPVGMGIIASKRKDYKVHRIWMWRFVGALWGSYWIFRLEAALIDAFFRDIEGLALFGPSWTAGVIGFVLGDVIRRRLDAREPSRKRAAENYQPLQT